MRIVHVIPTYVPAFRYGGPIRAVHGLAEAQAAAGDDVTVIATDADGDRRLAVPLGSAVPVGAHRAFYFPVSPPRRLARSPAMRAGLERMIPSCDVAHLHSVFLWPTWAAGRAARRSCRPYVVSPRGMLDRDLIRRRGALRKRLWLAVIERRTLAGAARIVATGEQEARSIRELGLDLAPLAIVPNGVDLDELEPPKGEQVSAPVAAQLRGSPYVLYLGRVTWKKRIDVLIDALPRAPGLRLLVAGVDDEGLVEPLAAAARRVGVADRVAFLGEVDGADRAALLHGAAALALPSMGENFGNAVLEAMACGVPVVVSPQVGLAPEVSAAGCGLVVEALPEAVGAALDRLARDRRGAEEMGRKGRGVALERYTWPVVAERLRSVYRDAGASG